MLFNKVRGFHDIYGDDIAYWDKLENALKTLFKKYNFHEVKLPILEKTVVFKRGIGETTDIVEKEMFTFQDSDESVSLRPEGTASLIRAYVENGLQADNGIKKFFYLGNMFRRERPQKGRFRQFTQIGVEALECEAPMIDAEIIALLYNAAKAVGISNFVEMQINSIGCPTCRKAYREQLVEFLSARSDDLCEDCKRRMDKNPMRVLDCKSQNCKSLTIGAPVILDFLCSDCRYHFEKVKHYLMMMGVEFEINPMIVRGLDYYVRTAFELVTDKLGAASAVGAGGRYDGLIKQMGGKDAAGIGFAIGLDRFVALMKEVETLKEKKADVFVIFFDDNGARIGLDLVKKLRAADIIVEYDYDMAGMKNQMKKADRSGAEIAIILGEDELKNKSASVKSLKTGNQEQVLIEDLVAACEKMVKSE